MKKIKIFIVDDHKLFRNGLKFILGEMPNVEITGEASDGKEFVDRVAEVDADVILMDINMPELNGIEASRIALQKRPELNILVLTMFDDEQYYNSMIELGIKGFILKDADNTELIAAITRIFNGSTYFSQDLLLKIIKNKSAANNVSITDREKEVLTYICKGFSNAEIADHLHISQRTVERHRASLLEKTDSSNSIKLVLFALRNNIASL